MTVEEERVAEQLRAYAGGLPVSQNDINLAYEELHDRLDERSAHRTRTRLLAVAAAAVIVGGTAFVLRDGTDGSAPPADDPSTSEVRVPDGAPPTVGALAGIWAESGGRSPLLTRFGADGTFAVDNAGQLDDPWMGGTYEIDGSGIDLTPLGGYGFAGPGTLCGLTWLAGLPEDGRLDVIVSRVDTGPNCGDQPVGEARSYTRVSPQSPAGAAIPAGNDAVIAIGADESYRLYGIWLQQGTGRLLRLAPDGTYSMDDGGKLGVAPDDAGTFDVSGPGVLKLTSGDTSRDCAPGDFASMFPLEASPMSLRLYSTGDACERASLEGAWIRLQ